MDPGDGTDRPLTDLELLMFFNLLVVAGSETTRNSIALGMAALIEHPDQLDALRRDRSLMPSATEEILRWTSATLYNRRTATRHTECAGTESPRETRSRCGGPRPTGTSRCSSSRSGSTSTVPNAHLTFGHRTHFCMGANLARLEIRVILDELLDRLEGFELSGPVERVRTNKHAGVWHMPMTFRPRRGA